MRRSGLDKNGLISDVTADSPIVRAYIALYEQLCIRTNDSDHPFVVVTSATSGEGRSTVAANLALCSAYAGNCKTLLIDADSERPAISDLFGVNTSHGLHDVLSGGVELDSAQHVLDGGKLSIMPAGKSSGSVAITAHARGLSEKMADWRSQFDWVFADTAPVLSSCGALTLGLHASGVLLVVDAVRTRAPVVSRAAARLKDAQVNTLGVVLNRRRHIIPRYAYRWL